MVREGIWVLLAVCSEFPLLQGLCPEAATKLPSWLASSRQTHRCDPKSHSYDPKPHSCDPPNPTGVTQKPTGVTHPDPQVDPPNPTGVTQNPTGGSTQPHSCVHVLVQNPSKSSFLGIPAVFEAQWHWQRPALPHSPDFLYHQFPISWRKRALGFSLQIFPPASRYGGVRTGREVLGARGGFVVLSQPGQEQGLSLLWEQTELDMDSRLGEGKCHGIMECWGWKRT